MFTAADLQELVSARPFAPFRLLLSDGGAVDVRSPEVVLVGRRFGVVGLLDPDATDTLIDRWTTVWYLHVARVEMLVPGAPPFSPPASAGPSTPAPV